MFNVNFLLRYKIHTEKSIHHMYTDGWLFFLHVSSFKNQKKQSKIRILVAAPSPVLAQPITAQGQPPS